MNKELAEWISKAEGDYLVARREIRARAASETMTQSVFIASKRWKNT